MKTGKSRVRLILILLILFLTSFLTCKILLAEYFTILYGEVHVNTEEKLNLQGKKDIPLDRLLRFTRMDTVDLRDTDLTWEGYHLLKESLPNCRILWEAPFQGVRQDPEAEKLSVQDLDRETAEELRNFRNLKEITVESCLVYEALDNLYTDHPGCTVKYHVELGGESWTPDCRNLVLRDADAGECLHRLPYLPETETVTLTGVLPPMERIEMLQRTFPQISFSWQIAHKNMTLESGMEVCRFTGEEYPDFLVENLEYFPELKQVDLRSCSLSNPEKRRLADSLPGIEVLWEITVGTRSFPHDAVEIEISNQIFEDTETLHQAIPCFDGLKKLVVLDSGLENEALDQLDRAFPDTRVIWNLDIGGIELRTDCLYYAPNKYGGPEYHVTDEILRDLRYCKDIQCVDVGHRPVSSCAWAAELPHLKYLIIADTGVQDLSPLQDLKELVFLEAFLTAVRDYSPLLKVTTLEDLNICYTKGDPEPIRQMTWLKRLWWDGNWFPEQMLQEALPDTEVECDSGSSTGLGWRKGRRYYEMRDLLGMPYMVG